MSTDKKVREPNFSSSEKMHLMNIIANKYALVLEDKKTDRASTSAKLQAWQVVEDEFNATSTSSTYRNATCLKKCYENRKKELRKTVAQERRDMMVTGGGPPAKVKKDDTDDLLLSILNKKSLLGLNNRFDDDADESLIATSSNAQDDDIIFEYAYESDEGKKREPLSKNVTPAERNNSSEEILKKSDNGIVVTSKDWNKYTPNQFKTPINPALGFTEAVTEKNVNKDEKTPTKSTSRRRPTTIIKSMTSSDIAKKYDLLMDKRLQLIDIELAHAQTTNALITKKLNLEIQLLQNQLSNQKNVDN